MQRQFALVAMVCIVAITGFSSLIPRLDHRLCALESPVRDALDAGARLEGNLEAERQCRWRRRFVHCA